MKLPPNIFCECNQGKEHQNSPWLLQQIVPSEPTWKTMCKMSRHSIANEDELLQTGHIIETGSKARALWITRDYPHSNFFRGNFQAEILGRQTKLIFYTTGNYFLLPLFNKQENLLWSCLLILLESYWCRCEDIEKCDFLTPESL